jgi:myo-inositol-1(or 4)-monophosphatase
MDLEKFWEHIFSEDKVLVSQAWDSLSLDEHTTVHKLLERVSTDPERIQEQRTAAKFALSCIDDKPAPVPLQLAAAGMPSTFNLPDGALDFARDLAHQTGERLKYASGQLIASTKKDGTLVTAFDLEADQQLTAAIKTRYPSHGVLSEEGGKTFGGQEWCWVIDPIDGTTNFTWGFPGWGVLIALLYQGQPVLGVAEFPPVGQQFYAVRGQGAWRKSESGYGDGPIHTAIDITLTATQLFAVGTRSLNAGKPDIPCKLRLPGSAGFDFAVLACGACVGAFDSTLHVWDIAALWPILTEAGAQLVTDYPGDLFPLHDGEDYGSVVFAVLGACTSELLSASLPAFAGPLSLPRPATSNTADR